MWNTVILGALQQLAEALSTQFRPLYVLINDCVYIRNKAEMISSDRVIYRTYSAHNNRTEIRILRKCLQEIEPEVIYTNGFRQLYLVSLIVREPGLLSKKPIILVTSHNSETWQYASKRLMMAFSCRLLADGIFTLAKYQENSLKKLGVPSLKIRTIPNAVDIEQFSPKGSKDYFANFFSENSHSHIIVNVANVNKFKGQDILIKCINIVRQKENNVRLVIMGIQHPGSSYDREIKSLITDYNLEKFVLFMENIDHVQVPRVLRSSDISVISSWNEVCPFILLESLSSGKVTISTKVGGIPDIIMNGVNGFLVEPGDFEGFADNILTVLNNRPLRLSVEKKARESAEQKYSYQTIGEEHREFISLLLKNFRLL